MPTVTGNRSGIINFFFRLIPLLQAFAFLILVCEMYGSGIIKTAVFSLYALYYFNIQSSFTVQNPRVQLVKIEHVILLYLSSANSDSALLTITHKNRALLTTASADRFAEIVKEQI